MSYWTKAEKVLARRYGPEFWTVVPHWHKVRTRVAERIRWRELNRDAWLIPLVTSIVAAVAIQAILWVMR